MSNEKLENICQWKKVVVNDEAKRKSGEGAITLSYDKPCYECDGSEVYAKKINCRAYVVLGK